jgi:hypothetical protein
VQIVCSTDGHLVRGLGNMALSVATARRGWATAVHVFNTRPLRAILDGRRSDLPRGLRRSGADLGAARGFDRIDARSVIDISEYFHKTDHARRKTDRGAAVRAVPRCPRGLGGAGPRDPSPAGAAKQSPSTSPLPS